MKILEAHNAVLEAEELRRQALERRRLAVLAAHEAGATTREIGAALGISHQRVGKIIDGNAPVKRPRRKQRPVYVPPVSYDWSAVPVDL